MLKWQQNSLVWGALRVWCYAAVLQKRSKLVLVESNMAVLFDYHLFTKRLQRDCQSRRLYLG